MPVDRALLLAVPLRHLESAAARSAESVTLPAGGPGDLDGAVGGMPVLVMAIEAGTAEVAAATWQATFVGRVPYEVGAPWPEGLPRTWVDEHQPVPAAAAESSGDRDDEDDDWDEDDDLDDIGPQSFLEVAHLHALEREAWLFANELVGKQARRGRSFRPRVPTLVKLPD